MFTQQPGQADKAKVAKRKFEVEEGDLLTLLNVYYAFHKLGGVEWSKSRHWCTSHFLRYKALKRATELREQLFKVLRRFGMTVVSCTNKEVILKTILMGLFPNAAYLHFDGKYRTVRGDIPLKVSSTSTPPTATATVTVTSSTITFTSSTITITTPTRCTRSLCCTR